MGNEDFADLSPTSELCVWSKFDLFLAEATNHYWEKTSKPRLEPKWTESAFPEELEIPQFKYLRNDNIPSRYRLRIVNNFHCRQLLKGRTSLYEVAQRDMEERGEDLDIHFWTSLSRAFQGVKIPLEMSWKYTLDQALFYGLRKMFVDEPTFGPTFRQHFDLENIEPYSLHPYTRKPKQMRFRLEPVERFFPDSQESFLTVGLIQDKETPPPETSTSQAKSKARVESKKKEETRARTPVSISSSISKNRNWCTN